MVNNDLFMKARVSAGYTCGALRNLLKGCDDPILQELINGHLQQVQAVEGALKRIAVAFGMEQPYEAKQQKQQASNNGSNAGGGSEDGANGGFTARKQFNRNSNWKGTGNRN
ncbi:hypothetical protein ACLSSQ_09415 [Azospira sp. APE16]|uniref:hypothetical protein n=1 Tax=Azospira sp. APE16 TaxID=3394231 RepID=UPI003A4D7799